MEKDRSSIILDSDAYNNTDCASQRMQQLDHMQAVALELIKTYPDDIGLTIEDSISLNWRDGLRILGIAKRRVDDIVKYYESQLQETTS